MKHPPCPNTTVAISLDLGGTQLKSAVITQAGEVLHLQTHPSDSKNTKETGLQQLIDITQQQRHWAELQGFRIAGVGMGIPGILNAAKGIVYRSPHFPDWQDFDLLTPLQQALPLPIFIDNDANYAALGELWKGSGQNHDHFILLTLGTGIGGGIILNRQLWRGHSGFAGEIGHLVIDRQGPTCNCGGRGCLELYASATGIALALKRRGLGNISPQELAQKALAGNTEAIEIYQQFGKALGCGIASLANILNIELILIGGGLSKSYELFIEACREAVRQFTYPTTAERLQIRPAQLGNQAGLVGAAKAVFG